MPSIPPIEQIPGELLLDIFEQLEIGDAASLSQASGCLRTSLSKRNVQRSVRERGGWILYWAARHGHANVARLALEVGAAAALVEPESVAGFLPTKRLNEDSGDEDSDDEDTFDPLEPILNPASAHPTEICSRLELDKPGCSVPTPLHIAIHYGNNDVAKALLDHGVDINGGLGICKRSDGPGDTDELPRFSDTINYWLDDYRKGEALPTEKFPAAFEDGGPEPQFCVEYSPLYTAIRSGNTEMAMDLLARGASPVTVTDYKCKHRDPAEEGVGMGHAVMDAIEAGDVEPLKHLIDTMPEESARRISQARGTLSAIFRLSWCPDGAKVPELLQLLLSHGASVDVVARRPFDSFTALGDDFDPHGLEHLTATPIQYAASKGNLHAFKALWAAGARVAPLPRKMAQGTEQLGVVGQVLACRADSLPHEYSTLEAFMMSFQGKDGLKNGFWPFLCFLQEQGHTIDKPAMQWLFEKERDLQSWEDITRLASAREQSLASPETPLAVRKLSKLEKALHDWYYSCHVPSDMGRPSIGECEEEIVDLLKEGEWVDWRAMPFSLPHFGQVLTVPDDTEDEIGHKDDCEFRSIRHADIREFRLAATPYLELWDVPIFLTRQKKLMGGFHQRGYAGNIRGFLRLGSDQLRSGPYYYRTKGIERIWDQMLRCGLEVQEAIPGRMPGHLIKALYSRDWYFLDWLVQNMWPHNISSVEIEDFIQLFSTAHIGVPDYLAEKIPARLRGLDDLRRRREELEAEQTPLPN
ncbi:hypothetical protein RB594_001035 [Gaeumannomyces avenae]